MFGVRSTLWIRQGTRENEALPMAETHPCGLAPFPHVARLFHHLWPRDEARLLRHRVMLARMSNRITLSYELGLSLFDGCRCRYLRISGAVNREKRASLTGG